MGSSDEQAIRSTVESFLEAVGRYDVDAIEQMVVPNASVGWASLRGDTWTTSTMSVEQWMAAARAEVDPTFYTEPVIDWTIHSDEARLAFVRADATLFVEGEAKRHNIDYFTLIEIDGEWKFLCLSFVGTPFESR